MRSMVGTPTWMGHVRNSGSQVIGIGKFHYRNGTDDNGFSEEIDAMHLAEGLGELIGAIARVRIASRFGRFGDGSRVRRG